MGHFSWFTFGILMPIELSFTHGCSVGIGECKLLWSLVSVSNLRLLLSTNTLCAWAQSWKIEEFSFCNNSGLDFAVFTLFAVQTKVMIGILWIYSRLFWFQELPTHNKRLLSLSGERIKDLKMMNFFQLFTCQVDCVIVRAGNLHTPIDLCLVCWKDNKLSEYSSIVSNIYASHSILDLLCHGFLDYSDFEAPQTKCFPEVGPLAAWYHRYLATSHTFLVLRRMHNSKENACQLSTHKQS